MANVESSNYSPGTELSGKKFPLEIHNPLSVNAREARKEKKLAKRRMVKKDTFDLYASEDEKGLDVATSVLGILGAQYLYHHYISPPEISAYVVAGLVPLYTVGSEIKLLWRFGKKEAKSQVTTPSPLHAASLVVYKGDKPIPIGPTTLKKGDEVLTIRVPTLGSEKKHEAQPLMQDMLRAIARDIRDNGPKNYKAVAITGDKNDISEGLDTNSVPRKTLLAGKHVVVHDRDETLSLLTREEFENLAETPRDLFLRVLQALNDTTVNKYLSVLRNTPDVEEKKNAGNMLYRALTDVIITDLEDHPNTGGYTKSTLDFQNVSQRKDGRFPIVDKRYKSVKIEKMLSGREYVQWTDYGGEYKQDTIDRALKMEYLTTEEILAASLDRENKDRKGQLAQTARKIMQEKSVEDLVENNDPDIDDLIAKLRELGVTDNPQKDSKTICKPKTLGHQSSRLMRRSRPVIAAASLFLAGQSIHPSYPQNLPGVLQRFESILPFHGNTHAPDLDPKVSKVVFPEGLPAHSLDWEIYAFDHIPPGEPSNPHSANGYWITQTSHEFSDGKWIINKDRAKEVSYPKNLADYSKLAFSLFRQINLGNIDTAKSIKLPILKGTKIGALEVWRIDSKKASYKVYELTDGTVELEFFGSPLDRSSREFAVYYTLMDSEASQIHGTTDLPPVDESRLDENAKKILFDAKALSSNPVTQQELIAQSISQSHQYSLVSPNKDRIVHAKTPEEEVNAIAESATCFCDTCNTEASLLSGANIAFGYLQEILANPDSAVTSRHEAQMYEEFLRGETFHAFGITKEGEIVDATATNVAGDPLTQEYIKLLQKPVNKAEWDKQENDLFSHATTKRDLEILAALIVLSSSFFAAGSSLLMMKRVHPGERVQDWIERSVLQAYSMENLMQAYEFFSDIAWSDQEKDNARRNMTFDISHKQQLLKRMRENLNFEKIDTFIHHPEQFQTKSTDSTNTIKLRLLARYLLH